MKRKKKRETYILFAPFFSLLTLSASLELLDPLRPILPSDVLTLWSETRRCLGAGPALVGVENRGIVVCTPYSSCSSSFPFLSPFGFPLVSFFFVSVFYRFRTAGVLRNKRCVVQGKRARKESAGKINVSKLRM